MFHPHTRTRSFSGGGLSRFSSFGVGVNVPRSRPQEKRGTSLIEILVVVAISVMLSSLAITYSKLGQRQISLYVETQKIGEMVFRAKTLALATYNDPGTPSCGYGFDIDYTTRLYSLFRYNPSPVPPNCSIANINPDFRYPIAQTEILNRDVVFDASKEDTLYSVLFVPPEPRVFMSNSSSGLISAPPVPFTIYLKTLDGSARAAVTVSPAGQVEF